MGKLNHTALGKLNLWAPMSQNTKLSLVIPSFKRKFQVPMLHAARSLNSHSTGTGTLPLPYRR